MQRHKSRVREGRKRAGKENSLVWTGCWGKLWGNQVPWNPPTQKGKITVPKDNGFSAFCYFNSSLSAQVFQTNKTHSAWQAQLSLLSASTSKACLTWAVCASTIWGNAVRQEDVAVTHSDKRTPLREISGSGCYTERRVTKGLSQKP